MSNKWYNHSYENSGSDNNVIYNSSFDTTFDYNHNLFLSKSLILPVVVNIRNVKVPCSMSRTLSSLCRCMLNLPRLQILALSNVQTCPHTLVDTWREYRRLASHIVVWQRYRIPVQSNWSPFHGEEVVSATPMTLFQLPVKHQLNIWWCPYLGVFEFSWSFATDYVVCRLLRDSSGSCCVKDVWDA